MAKRRIGLLDSGDMDITVESMEVESGMAQVLLDLSDNEKEGNNFSSEVETISELHTALEEFSIELQAAQEAGGLSPINARLASTYTKYLLKQAGYKANQTLVPAFENFHGYSARYDNTGISIQNIHLAMEGVWKDLKRMLDEFIKWIRSQWLKLFSGAEQLKRHASSVKQRATDNEFSGGMIDKDEVTAIAKKIIYKGGISKADLREISDAVNALPGGWSELIYNVAGKITELTSAVTTKKSAKKAADEILKILNFEKDRLKRAGEPTERKDGEPMKDGVSITQQTLPGNAVIELQIDPDYTKCRLKLKTGQEDTKKVTSLKPLSKDEVISLCDGIIVIADALIGFRKKADKLDKATDQLEAAGQKLSTYNSPEKKAKPGTESYYLGLEATEPDMEAEHDKITAKAENALSGGNAGKGKDKPDDVDKSNAGDYKAVGKFINSFGLDLLRLPMGIYTHSVKACYGYLDWCVESINAGTK
jgi:hypothetical protein